MEGVPDQIAEASRKHLLKRVMRIKHSMEQVPGMVMVSDSG